ncbi:TerC family protein [Paenibacillus sp. 1P07SE]|uniref:TerC family protein n=1 Tax=Paenibacillus sp. 1P07SE TaxID=3132209 RepID=UPI0039A5C801
MESLMIFLQIMFINLLLSGDNALVIAMASQHLPPLERRRAVLWGTACAIGLRCILTIVAISLLHIPYLQAAGAVLLFIIAVQLLLGAGDEGHERERKGRVSTTLAAAVWTIVAADFVMSLDNVLAIAAIADGQILLILLGIGLSIPIIIWGSQLLTRALRRLPSLIYLGAGLLGYAAGKMLVHDPGLDRLLFHGSETAMQAIPLIAIPFVISLALVWRRL